jgi:hypothetical protein
MSNQYWFKPKRWGYGATPTTWEGWTLTFGYSVVVGAATLLLVYAREHWLLSLGAVVVLWMAWGVLVAFCTAAMVIVSKRRTDGEWRWRWGRRANERFGTR